MDIRIEFSNAIEKNLTSNIETADSFRIFKFELDFFRIVINFLRM